MVKPSSKQVAFAKLIAGFSGVALPIEILADSSKCSKYISDNKAKFYCSTAKLEYVKLMAMRLNKECPNLNDYGQITVFLDKNASQYNLLFPRLKKGLTDANVK